MTKLKKHIVYTFLVCYVCTTAAALSIFMGYSKVSDPAVIGVFTALIMQTAAIIVAIIKSPEYFAEPEAMTNLQKEHAQIVNDLQAKLTQSMQERENMIGWIGTKIMPDDPKHPMYAWIKAQKQND